MRRRVYPSTPVARSLRALIFFLAILPAIWGNCPGVLTGACCCASASAHDGEASCCPVCAERDSKSPPTPCSHCPCVMARNGSAPAPVAVAAPAPDLSVIVPVALSDADPVQRSMCLESAIEIRAPGGPPGGPSELVGTVVLLV